MNSTFTLKFKSKVKKVVLLLLLAILVIFLFYSYHFVAQDVLGFEPKIAEILGTPSMYPTFPMTNKSSDPHLPRDIVAEVKVYKYNTLFSLLFRNIRYKLQRGDLVGFSTKNMRKSQVMKNFKPYFDIKRIIALPKETIGIKNLTVYVNDKPLSEPYIAKPFSTDPSNYLKESVKIKIPPNKIFVMGDNRELSSDSRDYGPIDLNDIKYYIPKSEIHYIPLSK